MNGDPAGVEGVAPDPASPAPGAPSRAYSRYVLGALFVVYIFNFLDRQMLNLFVEPIKKELGVSDTAMGLLTGLAFAAMYVVAGFPLARWADRHSRTALITVSMLIWSGMTAITGRTRTFPHLILARIGVGIGEAGFTPAAHSLLSDYFPPARRAAALATFSAGASVGTILAFIGGSRIAAIYGWRMPFLVLGLAGVPVALLFWTTVREPLRELRPSTESSWEMVRQLMSRRAFLFLAISASMHGFSSYGSSSWTAAFLMRVHDFDIVQVGNILALGSGIGASLGQIVGGRSADRLARRDVRWYMYQPAITSLLSLPFVLAFLFSWSYASALGLYIMAAAISASWTGPTYAMAQAIAPPHMRALAAAILVFMLNLVGLGLGPVIVGALNDLLAPTLGKEAVKYSLMFAAVPHALAAIFNLMAARTLKEDLKAAQSAAKQ